MRIHRRRGKQFARGMEVPYLQDSIEPPMVMLEGDHVAWMHYFADEGRHPLRHVRVTFQRLDAIRVCRGEYDPYPPDRWDGPRAGMYVIENSRWLRERYLYEATYYRDCYEFGGDVDEMLAEYDHYLFPFHDQFVEAIAMGVWFENSAAPFDFDRLPEDHPFLPLPRSTAIERFAVEGVECEIRQNPKPLDEILAGARYCSQPLFHFFLDSGDRHPFLRLDLRVRGGEARLCEGRYFGGTQATARDAPTLAEAKAMVEPHLRRVAENRRQSER